MTFTASIKRPSRISTIPSIKRPLYTLYHQIIAPFLSDKLQPSNRCPTTKTCPAVEGNGQLCASFCTRTKGLLFSGICVNIVLFSTQKGVMTSNDVREECLECHMTSNDVKGECYITMMTGRCVNKPDQTEPVGCYENKFISNFAKCM